MNTYLPSRSLWLVVLLALAARTATLLLLPDQGFGDAISYGWAGEAFWQTGRIKFDHVMPLYPVLVGLVGGIANAKILDVLISAVTVVLIHRLSWVLFRDEAGALLAALAAAIYPHFLFYAVSGLTETTYTFIVLSAFLCLYGQRYLAGSALLALSILERPSLEPLAPLLIMLFAIVVHRRSLSFALGRVAIYVLIYGALMTPWWLHQMDKYGTFVRLNLGDGIVLYSGNNPLNVSGGGVNNSNGADDADMSAFQKIEDPVARNQALKQAAVEFIRDNPRRFVELAAVKFVRFWRLWPYTPSYQSPVIIAASLLSFGPVLLLSAGVLLAQGRKRFRALSPIVLLTLFLTAVHMVTIGSIRYRLPLEAFMIALAGQGAIMLVRRARALTAIS
ncbi:MAG: hypothetical protein H7Y60_01960 [Rhodospirillaceae bacterium]|nr:hypothetical protein [Rhodospirillales bacterium]